MYFRQEKGKASSEWFRDNKKDTFWKMADTRHPRWETVAFEQILVIFKIEEYKSIYIVIFIRIFI